MKCYRRETELLLWARKFTDDGIIELAHGDDLGHLVVGKRNAKRFLGFEDKFDGIKTHDISTYSVGVGSCYFDSALLIAFFFVANHSKNKPRSRFTRPRAGDRTPKPAPQM